MTEEPLRSDDALEALRLRVRQAQEAAQRVAEETAAAAGAHVRSGATAPNRGWATPAADGGRSEGDGELHALLVVVEILRRLVPEDIQRQAVELVRELLLLLRALIDLVLDRLERGRRTPAADAAVRDIPVS